MLIVFSGNTSWGMYNFRGGLMRKLLADGYEICVVAPEDEYTEKIIASGLRFIPVKKLKRYSVNPINDLLLIIEYVKIYRQLKPDFIFHYTIKPNIYGSFAASICRIQSISITTGLGNAFSGKGLLFYFAKYLYQFSSKYAKEVWFLHAGDCNTFIKHAIIPTYKSFVLPGEGIDTKLFSPVLNNLANDCTTFLLFSRMQYDKGVAIFTAATELLINKGYQISSLLLGQIDMENPEAIPRQTIDEWQQRGIVKYLGSTTDVKNYIEYADAVVLPSYYMEGIPRVLMEAACMEKPVITTRNTGCAEVVDDGITGYLCEVKDVNDLALKMEQFINLPAADRKKMGIAGRKKIENQFDERIVFKIYKQKIEQYLPVSPVSAPVN